MQSLGIQYTLAVNSINITEIPSKSFVGGVLHSSKRRTRFHINKRISRDFRENTEFFSKVVRDFEGVNRLSLSFNKNVIRLFEQCGSLIKGVMLLDHKLGNISLS